MIRILFAFCAICLSFGTASAQDQKAASALSSAMKYVVSQDWDDAARAARPAGQVGLDIVEWYKLRAGNGDFEEYLSFLDRLSDWPGLPLLRKSGENNIPKNADPDVVLGYFADQEPGTGAGSARLADALRAKGNPKQADAELIRAWKSTIMSSGTEAAYLARYGALLAPYHNDRIDMLLWQGRVEDARRMNKVVSGGHRALSDARIALITQSNGVDGLIAAVPANLKDDPGLAYARFQWRVKKKRQDDALALMFERSTSADALGKPEKWANKRRSYARQLMRDGKAKQAYQLASRHFLTGGDDYSDLEWLAGYIALSDLNDPKTALTHFQTFRRAVNSPISLGRAGYWEGRAYDALGDHEAAQVSYEFGAEFQTSFYGQLAAEKVDLPMDTALAGREVYPDLADSGFRNSTVFQAALLFQKAGYPLQFTRFTRHLAETLTLEERGTLAQVALELKEPFAALYLAKYSARDGDVLMRAYFPVTDLIDAKLPVPEELALSIARRESEFYAAAKSGVGARGLMQLMPRTAKAMAKKVGVKYSLERLTADPKYNATLGSAYLEELIDDLGAYYPFVAAGYNAGPSRPLKWAERYGNPRRSTEHAVDWIEHIPFRETRNYVMRVMESLPVYRARLSGEPVPFSLSKALTGG